MKPNDAPTDTVGSGCKNLAQQEIQEIYGVPKEDCDKFEAAEAMAAYTLENLEEGDSVHPWREKDLSEFKSAVEIVSGGANTVLIDDWGIPSVMVRVPMLVNSELLENGSENVHPAFLLQGIPQKVLYVSKFQNILINGRGYSLPLKDPAYGIAFDKAVEVCKSKGDGWHLSSFALRSALALWSRKNGFLPHGNSYEGCDYYHHEEKGLPTQEGRVATGSGPVTWAHNREWNGIFDLSGNVNERDSGIRLMDGEIQVIPNGDCALAGCDISKDSADWRAILPDGSFTVPGSPDTLKYDYRDETILLTTHIEKHTEEPCGSAFQDIIAEEGLKVPEILYSMMLFPEDPKGNYDGWRWIKTKGECLPMCGGAHLALHHAGVFFVGLTYPREKDYNLVGFRSACIINNERII